MSGYSVTYQAASGTVTIPRLSVQAAVGTARALLNEGKRPRLVDADGRTVSLEVLEPLVSRRYR